MYIATVLSICLLLVAIGNADLAARLAGGQQVDNLRQFPHHVYIIPFHSSRKCGGSILNAQWVLTSAACIKDSIRLDLHFGKKNEYDNAAAYYSISVNSDQVYVYPTNYDDVALVRLPTRLVFSDSIMPIAISKLPIESLRNRFAVMPGFNDLPTTWPPTTTSPWPTTTIKTTQGLSTTTTKAPATTTTKAPTTTTTEDPVPTGFASYDDNLKYGMFNVLENTHCKQSLGSSHFDEYTQLCTEGWGNNPNTPCDSDFGSGLIVGWPAQSELIGMFSMYSPSCDSYRPAVFTYVAKYFPWIESMIQG